MEYESLENKKFWIVKTHNYSQNYIKYFDESKVVMGLGLDIDLIQSIKSGVKIKHKFKDKLNKFVKIKNGDYLSWILYETVEKDNNIHIQKNVIIGEVNGELSDIYEYKKSIGHIVPIKLIKKSTRLINAKFKCYKIDNVNSFNDFDELESFDKLDNEKNSFYFKIYYFGLEYIDEKENELVIDLRDLCIQEKVYLDIMKKISKGDILLGEFVYKKDEFMVTRVIGEIKEISLDKDAKIVLAIISKEKKKYGYGSVISIDEYSENSECINILNRCFRKHTNTIFYGPPGTGKTYNIDNEALKIIDTATYIKLKGNRKEIHNKIMNLQSVNKIRICTFHQSYGYEEFVEGLRPDNEGDYKLQDGLLKQIAIDAIFEGLLYELKEELLYRVNYEEDAISYEDKKKLVLKYLNNSLNFDFFNCSQYVLVIDEINRGNISKILGELITLLEEDKRLGNENEMILKLAYSKEDFTLPPNLHIIGTMNSSDKSIAPIDIALRRRFKFVEIMPNEELLCTIDGIDLKQMLKKINDRIEYLYDRDHMIGHAYFIDNRSLEDIKATLIGKILPLLQEYFYEDFDKIGLVLGGIGSSKADKFIIYKEDMNPKSLFKEVSDYDFKTINKYIIKSEIAEAEIKSIYE